MTTKHYFSCPKCERPCRWDPDLAGRRVLCRRCREKIRVPKTLSPDQEVPPETQISADGKWTVDASHPAGASPPASSRDTWTQATSDTAAQPLSPGRMPPHAPSPGSPQPSSQSPQPAPQAPAPLQSAPAVPQYPMPTAPYPPPGPSQYPPPHGGYVPPPHSPAYPPPHPQGPPPGPPGYPGYPPAYPPPHGYAAPPAPHYAYHSPPPAAAPAPAPPTAQAPTTQPAARTVRPLRRQSGSSPFGPVLIVVMGLLGTACALVVAYKYVIPFQQEQARLRALEASLETPEFDFNAVESTNTPLQPSAASLPEHRELTGRYPADWSELYKRRTAAVEAGLTDTIRRSILGLPAHVAQSKRVQGRWSKGDITAKWTINGYDVDMVLLGPDEKLGTDDDYRFRFKVSSSAR